MGGKKIETEDECRCRVETDRKETLLKRALIEAER